jgi:hypothetical protein
MDEITALEKQIADALPNACDARDAQEIETGLSALVAFAHDVLCNAWPEGEEGTRLHRLRTIAGAIRRFAPAEAE